MLNLVSFIMYDYTIVIVCLFSERCGVKVKKKNGFGKVIIVVLLVIILLVTVIAIRYWDTITAVIDGLSYSAEEIENIRVENQKEVDRELAKYPDLHFRDLTDEEIKALSEGKIEQSDVPYLVTGRKVFKNGVVMTTEEYEELIKKEKEDKEQEESLKPEEKQPEVKPPDKPAEENVPKTNPELEAVLEKFFVLKANLLADIDSRVNGMISEYKSIPKKERTKAVKNEYANKAISLMSVLEPQYDSQFEAVVQELETVIEKIDGDRNLVDTVRTAYKKEKAALKAKYVSKARKHL